MPARIKIIYAEDHYAIRTAIKLMLEESGMKVIAEANTGKELIDLLKSGFKPDVILLDVEMPVMNGLSALRIIRKEYPANKVILFTGLADSEDMRVELLSEGADAVLGKNADTRQLLNVIKAVASGNVKS